MLRNINQPQSLESFFGYVDAVSQSGFHFPGGSCATWPKNPFPRTVDFVLIACYANAVVLTVHGGDAVQEQ